MDTLPNELQDMIASHLSKEDLRPYRLVNRRYEPIANRLLFDTLKLSTEEDLEETFTIRPAIAQYVKRLHVDNLGSDEESCNNPQKLLKLMQALHSGGAAIDELRIRVGWDRYGTVTEQYLGVLVDSASMLSNVTRLNFDHHTGGGNTKTNNGACIALNTLLSSLPNLRIFNSNIAFNTNNVVPQNLAALRDTLTPFEYACCEKNRTKQFPNSDGRLCNMSSMRCKDCRKKNDDNVYYEFHGDWAEWPAEGLWKPKPQASDYPVDSSNYFCWAQAGHPGFSVRAYHKAKGTKFGHWFPPPSLRNT